MVYGEMHKELVFEAIPKDLIAASSFIHFGSAMRMPLMDAGGTAELFRYAHTLGKTTLMDCCAISGIYESGYWLDTLDGALRETDLFVPSYTEACMLTGKTELPDIRDALEKYGFRYLLIKLGGQGCYLTDYHEEQTIPTYDGFERVDTTGVGDSFVGGLIRGLLEEWPVPTAVRFANAVASYNITRKGATGGVPDFETVYRFVTNLDGGADLFPLLP